MRTTRTPWQALRRPICALGAGLAGITMLTLSGATSAGAIPSRPPRAAAAAPSGPVGPAGYPGAYGTLPGPGIGVPEQGVGTVSIGEQPGAAPNWILPVVPAAYASVFDIDQFVDYMWRPLWWAPAGPNPEIDYRQSIAGAPVLSNDDKTVVIKLRPDWKWSDGQPVTAKDVEFFIDLVEAAVKISPTDYSNYTPGLFPDFIASMSTPATDTLVLDLKSTFNPDFLFLDELTDLYALPSHAWAKTSASGPIIDFTNPANAAAIYTFLSSQSRTEQTYATNPLWQVTDGPFRLRSYDGQTGGNTFVPNHSYSGPVKPHIAELEDVPFTSDSAEVAALLVGKLTVGSIEDSDLPQAGKITAAGYDVWGDADFAFSYSPYNFEDKTGDFDNIIKQLYIRQALAHLDDEQSLIRSKGAFDGAGAPDYGPVAPVPQSPFTPPDALGDPYPPSIQQASNLLSSHGWNVVPNGQTTCVRAGIAADECGAGIPVGTPLAWNLYYADSPAVIGTQDEVFAAAAKQVGIGISLESRTFDYIIANLSDASNPYNANLWAMQDFGGFANYLDPTTYQIFNTGGSFNIGGYSDPQADTDIENSVHSLDPSAEETEASYLTAQQPGLFQPNGDSLFAFSDTLHGPAASFADASQYQFSPEYWYYTAPRVVAAASTPDGKGYLIVTSAGSVYPHGDAHFYGDLNGVTLAAPIVGVAEDPETGGYWLVGRDGGVFAFHAPYLGSAEGLRLNAPVVGITSVPGSGSYRLVAADGGVFDFGPGAHFYGSMGGTRLNKAIVGIAADPQTGGYWLVAADGGIFSFRARFLGSTGDLRLNAPIVGMDGASGDGYRFVASDGGLFDFGAAIYAGSLGGSAALTSPVSAIASPPEGNGYWLVEQIGNVTGFGGLPVYPPA